MTAESWKNGCFSDTITPWTTTTLRAGVDWLWVYEITIATSTPMARTAARPMPRIRVICPPSRRGNDAGTGLRPGRACQAETAADHSCACLQRDGALPFLTGSPSRGRLRLTYPVRAEICGILRTFPSRSGEVEVPQQAPGDERQGERIHGVALRPQRDPLPNRGALGGGGENVAQRKEREEIEE